MIILRIDKTHTYEYWYGVGKHGQIYRWYRAHNEPINQFFWENWEYVPSVGF